MTARRDGDGLAEIGRVSAELMHDLAAEIDTLRGWTEIVVGGARQHHIPPADMEALSAQVERLGAMVRDLVAWITRRRVDLRFRPQVEAGQAVTWISRLEAVVAVETAFEVPAGTEVAGPGSFFARITTNLFRNAIRHARTRVRVSLVPDRRDGRDGLVLRVEDDGPGLPDGLPTGLTRPAARVDPLGHGLGLTSTTWLAEQLDGGAPRYSRSDLGGACFEVWVPTTPARAAEGDGAVETAPANARMRVAVLDDDPTVRRVMVRILGSLGMDAHGFGADADVAEKLLAGAIPADAVMIDRNLGSVDGFELWLRLRERRPELARHAALFTGGLPPRGAPPELVVLQKPVSMEDVLGWLQTLG